MFIKSGLDSKQEGGNEVDKQRTLPASGKHATLLVDTTQGSFACMIVSLLLIILLYWSENLSYVMINSEF